MKHKQLKLSSQHYSKHFLYILHLVTERQTLNTVTFFFLHKNISSAILKNFFSPPSFSLPLPIHSKSQFILKATLLNLTGVELFTLFLH